MMRARLAPTTRALARSASGPASNEGPYKFIKPEFTRLTGLSTVHDPWTNKGTGFPMPERDRLRIRGPSFVSLSILPAIVPGNFLTDIASILGSLDFVMGECDR